MPSDQLKISIRLAYVVSMEQGKYKLAACGRVMVSCCGPDWKVKIHNIYPFTKCLGSCYRKEKKMA